MVRKLDEWPSKGELVIGKVKNIKSYGCFVELPEYRKEGMVHISEISSKWVRNIRNFVKLDQMVILKVLKVDPNKNRIDLSLKKVSDQEKGDKLEEWKKEKRAEKLLKIAGEKLGKDLDKAYEEAGNLLMENYYTLYKGLEEAVLRGEEALEEAKLPKKWIKVLTRLAKEEVTVPDKEIKGVVQIVTWEPNGIRLIKQALGKISDGIEVRYISAPKYKIIAKAKRYKIAEEKLSNALRELRSELEGKATISFERK